MRLYSRTGAIAIDDSGEHYTAGKDGAFDLPEELGQRLAGFATAGQPQWETDIGRQRRLISEELERRKDPATLLDAVNQLVKAAQATAPAEAEAPAEHAKAPAAKAAPAKAAAK
jgi:hypothetical protein